MIDFDEFAAFHGWKTKGLKLSQLEHLSYFDSDDPEITLQTSR